MNKVQAKRTPVTRVTRRAPGQTQRSHEEISDRELTQLAKASCAHEWLRDPEQDVYSRKDGKPAQWPPKHTNGAA